MPAAILEVVGWGNWCQAFLLASIPLSLFVTLQKLRFCVRVRKGNRTTKNTCDLHSSYYFH